MIKPIDMQVVLKNVDSVAKINKAAEQNITSQQAHAQQGVEKEVNLELSTITQSNETEKKQIDKDEQGKKRRKNYLLKEKKEKKESKEHKAKDPDKGNLLDLEG